MTFYDIHTHNRDSHDRNVVSILNHSVENSDFLCKSESLDSYCSLGLHPWKIRNEDWLSIISFIEKEAANQSVKAIGECGLDKLTQAPMILQQQVFLAQILISEKLHKKPLIIHCVKALDELVTIKKQLRPQQMWIIHGFRGKPKQALQLVLEGFFLSFGPGYNPDTIKIVPDEHLFLETDDSGQPIESVYNEVAALRQVSLNELAANIARNVSLLGI